MSLEYLGYAYQLQQASNKPTSLATGSSAQKKGFDWGFLGNVADAIPQVIGQFNGKFQNNQLAIAEANARAAEAQANAANAQPQSNTIIWVTAILAILIIAFLLMRKK